MEEQRLQTRMFTGNNPEELTRNVNTFISGRTANVSWWESNAGGMIAVVDITDMCAEPPIELVPTPQSNFRPRQQSHSHKARRKDRRCR